MKINVILFLLFFVLINGKVFANTNELLEPYRKK